MLNFLGLSSQPQHERFFPDELDHLDESTQRILFEYAAKKIIETLGIDEAAKYVSFFLQKRYETVNPKEVFENVNSFVVVFVKAVLDTVDYPKGTNKQEIYALLREYTDEKRQHRDTSATAIGEKIVRLFNNIPNSVITLLLPSYHSFLKNSTDPDKDKRIFRDVFFDRFFKVPMLDSPEEPNLTLDFKMGLLTNAKAIDPFKKVTEKLDEANKRFTKIDMNPQSVNTARAIYESHLQIFQFVSRVKRISDIFIKFADTFNLGTQSDWGYIYSKVVTKLEELSEKLTDKTPETLKGLLAESQADLVEALKGVIKDPLDDLSLLIQLGEEIRDLQERVCQLKEILSDFAKLFKDGSPANLFYVNALAESHNLFQKLTIALVYNIGTLSKEERKEEIAECQLKVSQVVAGFINEPLDKLTPLHRLVMSGHTDQQVFQRQLEFLLRQGAKVEVTTTNYERKMGGLLAALFSLTSKEPLNAVQLADLFGHGAVLSQALATIRVEKEAKSRKSSEIIEALASITAARSRSSSASDVRSHTSSATLAEHRIPSATMVPVPEAEESALASSQTVTWQKGHKRDRGQRTPEVTPRNSTDNNAITAPKVRRFGSGAGGS